MSKSFHTLQVKNIKQETPDAITFTFEVPGSLKELYKYTQGQHLTLRFIINGKEERRSYSMCSSPVEEDLSVTVKRVKGGVVSNYIHDHLQPGSEVEAMPPEGWFFTPLDADNKKNYYFFAAGSGITPLMSMMKTILEQEQMSFIFLLYGNRNEDTIIFKEELHRLSQHYAGQLHLTHLLSQPNREKTKGLGGLFSKGKISWTGKSGRINGQAVREFLQENPPRHKASEYFLCGPGDMIDAAEKALTALGTEAKNIHHEYFSSAAPATAGTAVAGIDGARVVAILDKKRIETTVPAGKSILAALLDAKADAPYSCTAGACATCMAKLLKGKVKMDVCYALDESEIAKGYILTCQSHPVTDEVELTYDI